ncbi:MAG: hypothetical protein HYZ51_04060 [Candidatus Doudnabacteria bacterium]|nr:hypothetical protein [Candidatus Doudnabacteria bacterium]
MENEQNQSLSANVADGKQTMTEEDLLMEILENSRKTKKYMQWQMYITIALVILPLLAMIFIIPMVLRSVGDAYGSVLQ